MRIMMGGREEIDAGGLVEDLTIGRTSKVFEYIDHKTQTAQ